jgi:hypothetical protein
MSWCLKVSSTTESYYNFRYPLIQWKINNHQDINYTDVISPSYGENNRGLGGKNLTNIENWKKILKTYIEEWIFTSYEERGESFLFNEYARFFPKGNLLYIEIRKGCKLAAFIKYKKLFSPFNVTLKGFNNLICIEQL